MKNLGNDDQSEKENDCEVIIMRVRNRVRAKKKSQNFMIALAFILVLTFCTTYGNRTRDSSVKGRRLNPLTNTPFVMEELTLPVRT